MKNKWPAIPLVIVLLLTVVLIRAHHRKHSAVTGPPPVAVGPHLPVNTLPPNPCLNIYRLVCHDRSAETHDPTGTMRLDIEGEVQALKVYKNIVHEHPRWKRDQIQAELVNQIYTLARRQRVESAFHWVERAIERFIDKQTEAVFNVKEKKRLKARLRRVQLQMPPEFPYTDEPDLITKDEIYYERMTDDQMRLRVGGAYLLTAKSWFNLIFTFGHEMGHSIDPCELRSARFFIPAYDRLSACFIHNGLIAVRKTRTECGNDDQLSETFADWLAVHVTADALALFSTEFHGQQIVNAAANSVRDLCEQEEGLSPEDVQFHPPPSIRIGRIFGRNPEIRQILGCAPLIPPNYCNFNSVIPIHPLLHSPHPTRGIK